MIRDKEIENRIDEITNDFGNRITEIFSLKFSNSRLVVCPQRYEIRVGMSNGRTEPVGPKADMETFVITVTLDYFF